MNNPDSSVDPDWDTPLTITLTPDAIMRHLFTTAESVHTGWDSCVEHNLIVGETTALDEDSGNYCRLVEQEYLEDQEPEITWHDWVVVVKLGEVCLSAHWRARNQDSPAEWDWCTREAEQAFSAGCLLVGKRARRGWIIEGSAEQGRAPRTQH